MSTSPQPPASASFRQASEFEPPAVRALKGKLEQALADLRRRPTSEGGAGGGEHGLGAQITDAINSVRSWRPPAHAGRTGANTGGGAQNPDLAGPQVLDQMLSTIKNNQRLQALLQRTDVIDKVRMSSQAARNQANASQQWSRDSNPYARGARTLTALVGQLTRALGGGDGGTYQSRLRREAGAAHWQSQRVR